MHDSLRIVSVQIGRCRSYLKDGDPSKPWTSAIDKCVVDDAIDVGAMGLAGDEQADKKNHGGVDKAVLGYCHPHFSQWNQEFPEINWGPGAFGENLTLDGWLESDVCIGDVFECRRPESNPSDRDDHSAGELDTKPSQGLRLQISQPREPCWKLSQRWGLPKLAVRVQQTRRTGWYFRVLNPGQVQAGATLHLIERPAPEFTIETANDILFAKPRDAEADLKLAACEPLSEAWKENLIRRNAKHVE
ncbi:MOSC domain-containing protein [Rhodopirellula halodulae]|uniref:MOSC domain-containing protein n=1 Tax=Rhodopirellula halodulae TaxID=2894198 RepID=UPI001E3604F1|nr:MOSC domain-containing protein [Rhodopirellula sp. JC737]MCC9656562.1 MOSC domain-containing protein [Rhodopirellula sp. JC737]